VSRCSQEATPTSHNHLMTPTRKAKTKTMSVQSGVPKVILSLVMLQGHLDTQQVVHDCVRLLKKRRALVTMMRTHELMGTMMIRAVFQKLKTLEHGKLLMKMNLLFFPDRVL
jgi:hypothetical protein